MSLRVSRVALALTLIVREFLMAEIERKLPTLIHSWLTLSSKDYVDPDGAKKHHRFQEVVDVKINLLDKHVQEAGKTDAISITIGEAVRTGKINNETVGYFVGKKAYPQYRPNSYNPQLEFNFSCSNSVLIHRRYDTGNTWQTKWVSFLFLAILRC
jgi:hypothetical protein